MHKFKKLLALLLAVQFTVTPALAGHDLAERSNVTQHELQDALRGNLKSHAETFVECEEEYGVNAVILSSIAALESGWGKSPLAQNKNNIFGWRQNDGKYREFGSLDECIRYVAKSVSERYLNASGAYYSGGTSVNDISGYYSESPDWSKAVCEISDQVQERCDNYEPEFICPS